MRDLLKRQGGGASTSSTGPGLTQEDINEQLLAQQQKHLVEIQKQRELYEKQLHSCQDEVQYYKKKQERTESELSECRQQIQELKESELQLKKLND